MMATHTKNPSGKKSKVRALWTDVESRYFDLVSIDLGYIDRLADERVKDEFVHLPFETARQGRCAW